VGGHGDQGNQPDQRRQEQAMVERTPMMLQGQSKRGRPGHRCRHEDTRFVDPKIPTAAGAPPPEASRLIHRSSSLITGLGGRRTLGKNAAADTSLPD
jgi:hypothetical protein